MPLDGEYEPSPWDWVRDQVEKYEATDGQEAWDLQGKPVVVLTTRGRKTGKLRKSALMRVEKDGQYAVVASLGGAPNHPLWYLNILDDPIVTLQDGANVFTAHARTATPEEKERWWPVAVEAWPDYAEYQQRTERDIPLVLLDPVR